MIRTLHVKQKLSQLLLGQKGGGNRMKIIECLRDRPYNMNQLAEHLNLNYRTIKHHMKVLRDAELVTTSSSGGYGEVFFISPDLEGNMEIYEDLKRKMRDVTRSPKFFQNVLEQTSDAVIVIDDDGDVIFWNTGAEEMFGIDDEEVLGKKIDLFTDDDLLDRCLGMAEEDEDVIQAETGAMTREGEELEISLTMDCIEDQAGKLVGYSLMLRDITEENELWRKLESEREQFISILDGLELMAFVVDPEKYEILYANPKTEEWFGEEMVGGVCYETIQDQDGPCDFCPLPLLLEGNGNPHVWEHKNPKIDRYFQKTDRMIEWSDGREVLLEVALDITERKIHDEMVRKKRIILQSVMDNTEAQIAYLDPDFNFLAVNEAYAEGAGFSQQDLLGKNHFDLFPNEENREIFEKVRRSGEAVQFKDRPFEFESGPRREGGTTYWNWTLAPVKDRKGNILGLVLSVYETTHYKNIQRDLEASLKAFERVAQHSSDLILRFDRDHKFLFANSVLKEVTGRPPEEFIGRTSEDMGLPRHLCDLWNDAIDHAFEREEVEVMYFDMQIGDEFHRFEARIVPESKEERRPDTVLCIARRIDKGKKPGAIKRGTEAEEMLEEETSRRRTKGSSG